MSFTETQRKQIDKCVRNKIYITDDDIITCIMKSKPKKRPVASSRGKSALPYIGWSLF
jgi:hypothetical protein